jgi:RNA polymerase-binding transcription factor DksA
MAEKVPALDSARLAELRARLEDERNRLRSLSGDAAPDRIASIAELDPGDAFAAEPQDFGDQGYDLQMENTEMALSRNDQLLLDQVERALRRMDEGTYGLSEVTGKPIPIERLEALPWATTNVDDEPNRQQHGVNATY